MTGRRDDDAARFKPSDHKYVDYSVYWKMIPYLIGFVAVVYAFIFAPVEAAYVAWAFIVAIVSHFWIRLVLADKKRDAMLSTYRIAADTLPYPSEIVEAYMRDGRPYWIRHYEKEGMAVDVEFAEAHRRLHLRGLCDRNSCYFCFYHAQSTPYV